MSSITKWTNKLHWITLDHREQRRLQKGVGQRVYAFTDDKREAAGLFKESYREIKDRFGVSSYKDLKRKELLTAINYIENWVPRKVS
ncbi:ORF6C domain-containing protein [Bacillus atrophaeus]|uniref:ORF6C domain-containing protein n=1 Tax=Bacillus atrophaeus TaxID=1452 RepID=UPI002E15B998